MDGRSRRRADRRGDAPFEGGRQAAAGLRPFRWLRAPLVHFVCGGALLFAAVHATSREAPIVAPVVVTAADVARLRSDYTRETGLDPTPDDEAAIVDKTVDEELLFREAVARGLDRHDRSVRNWLVEQMRVLDDGRDEAPERLYAQAQALGLDRSDLVVRRILVQKMRLLATRLDEQPPSPQALAAFYAAHRDEYRPPDRVTFWHVFLSASAHGTSLGRDADALLARLRRDGRPADAVAGSDAFPVPPHVVGQSAAQLAKLFGPEFADAVARATFGDWAGPVASPYGLHLVWLERRDDAEPPPLDAVRGQVVEHWHDAERARRLIALRHELERRYPLQIESSAWQDRRRS
jgi:hypothetical protein